MDQSIHLITRDRHGAKKWNRVQGFGFAAKTNVVPIAAAELSSAARAFPLGFLKQADQYLLVAVLGLLPEQNLFVAPDGRWLGQYVPAALRGYPFRLGRTADENNFSLLVDESSGLVLDSAVGEGGVPFFDLDGNPAEGTKQVLEFLVKTKQSGDAAARAVAALVEADLIEPWPLKVRDGGAEKSVGGIGRIAEARLNTVAPEQLAGLRDAGALSIAYAQLLSMGNIAVLGTLGQAHSKAREAKAKRMEIPMNSFVDSETDDLKIDWDRFLKDKD